MSVAREWPTTERASVAQCLGQLAEAKVLEVEVVGEVRRFRLLAGERG